jgi:alkyldihydroxyacetonephosphate synthase
MRAMFQSGMRPAVARLYDPFDSMLAKQGSVKKGKSAARAPGLGTMALRQVLRRPGILNELLHSRVASGAMGGAMLIVIFEGTGDEPTRRVNEARRLVESREKVTYEGEGPAQKWLQHRYSVSYRQAPVFASGAFADTIEVAATWSQLPALFDGVRKALGEHVFVMAHFSHAYPDGCCIYFSFAGSAAPGVKGWNAACEETYDRAWKAALDAAIAAGGTVAHHHGVGRSKAPRLGPELGLGVDVIRRLQRAFDPKGIMNPGNLLPR